MQANNFKPSSIPKCFFHNTASDAACPPILRTYAAGEYLGIEKPGVEEGILEKCILALQIPNAENTYLFSKSWMY